jgi:hypothetical protein
MHLCYDNIVRYDFHSGSQDTMGLHEDALACIEFSLMTGKEDSKQSYILIILCLIPWLFSAAPNSSVELYVHVLITLF